MSNKILTFDEILAAPDLDVCEVDVPEWKGKVKIKELTKAARERLSKQATVNGQVDSDKLQVLMLAECLEEPKITVEQAQQLWEKSAAAVDKILFAILEINGLSEIAQKEMQKSFRAGNESPKGVS